MQLVEGEPLHVARAHASLERRVRWIRGAAAAVLFAHGRGVIHRDLKPGNIMVDRRDQVFVLDFGLARRADASASGPRVSDEAGTVNYMAPEQFAGEPSRSSDIYGLGATLYELVTGRPPFAGDSREAVLLRVLQDEPVWPRKLSPETPRDLEAIILKCLEKEPGRRYADVGALVEDLDAYLAGEALRHARRPTLGYVLWKRVRRHRTLAATVAVALGGLLAMAFFFARERGLRAEAEARDLYERALGAMKEQRLLEAEALFARSLVLDDRRETREELLGARVRAPRFLWRAQGLTQAMAFTPDGARLAGVSYASDRLRVLDAATGAPLVDVAVGAEPGGARGIVLGPDGLGAAIGGDRDARLLDLATGRETALLRGHEDTLTGLAFAPDGRLATSSNDGTIRLWGAAGGAPLRVLSHGPAAKPEERPVGAVAFLPGDRLASGGWDRKIRIFDLASGALSSVRPGHDAYVVALAASSDGRLLASGGGDACLRLWDVDGDRALATFHGQPNMVMNRVAFTREDRRVLAVESQALHLFSVAGLARRRDGTMRELLRMPMAIAAISPDGRRLATGEKDAVRVWGLESAEARFLFGHDGSVNDVAWSREGRVVATAGGLDCTVRLWDPAAGRELRALGGAGAERDPEWSKSHLVCGVALAPDGARVAAASLDGTVRVWDSASGAEIGPPRRHGDEVFGVAWRPDGLAIASTSKDRTVRLWDAATGAELWKPAPALPHPTWAAAWRPDGARLAVSLYDGEVRILDGASGEETEHAPVRFPDLGYGLAFAPDGRRLAAACGDGHVRMVDLPRGEVATLRSAHEPGGTRDHVKLNAIAWSPEGGRLATAGEDGIVRLWDVAEGREVAALRGHGGAVNGVSFSPDGRELASASQDGTLAIWTLDAVDRFFAARPADLDAEVERQTGLRVDDESRAVVPCLPER